MFNFWKIKKFSNQSSQKWQKAVLDGNNLCNKFIKKLLSVTICCSIGFIGYKNISHSIEKQEEHHEECTWTLTDSDGSDTTVNLDLGINHSILPGHILKVACEYGNGMAPLDYKYHYFNKNDTRWCLASELCNGLYKNIKIVLPTTIQWKNEHDYESNIASFPLFEKVNKQVNIEKGKISTFDTFSNVGCEKCLSSLNLSYIENETEISESEIVSANIDSSTGNISFSGLNLGNSKVIVKADGKEVANFNITVVEPAISEKPQAPSGEGTAIPEPTLQYLESKVNIMNQTQRIRVYDTNEILPSNSKFVASVVKKHNNIDDTHKIENVFSYNLSLTDENGTPLEMPLEKPVDLLFEIVDGLDKDELQLILVEQLKDIEFEEELVSLDGANWLKVKTSHFSPYALIDTLSEKEEAELLNNEKTNFVPTGDLETSLMILCLGIASTASLSVLMKLSSKKKKSED